jgi:hypothetical protein
MDDDGDAQFDLMEFTREVKRVYHCAEYLEDVGCLKGQEENVALNLVANPAYVAPEGWQEQQEQEEREAERQAERAAQDALDNAAANGSSGGNSALLTSQTLSQKAIKDYFNGSQHAVEKAHIAGDKFSWKTFFGHNKGEGEVDLMDFNQFLKAVVPLYHDGLYFQEGDAPSDTVLSLEESITALGGSNGKGSTDQEEIDRLNGLVDSLKEEAKEVVAALGSHHDGALADAKDVLVASLAAEHAANLRVALEEAEAQVNHLKYISY